MRWISWCRSVFAVGLATASAVCGQSIPAFNRDVVVLDPAHGGSDGGARINDHLEEKDVTLELSARLRSLLAARGFTVVSTRDGEPDSILTNDQRALAANKAHAVACLVIHASGSGNGVYLGSSTLGSPIAAVPAAAVPSGSLASSRTQEPYVSQSIGLANQIGTALSRARVPLAMGRVALRPLDILMCPAVSIEIAPLHNGSDTTPLSDEEYQQRVAEAIAGALIFWKNQAQPPTYLTVPATSPAVGAKAGTGS